MLFHGPIPFYVFVLGYAGLTVLVPWLLHRFGPSWVRACMDWFYENDDFSNLCILTIVAGAASPIVFLLLGYGGSEIRSFAWEALKGLVTSLPFF